MPVVGRGRRRKTKKTRALSTKQTKEVNKLAKQTLNRNSEAKYANGNYNGTTISNSGSIQLCIPSITQGDGNVGTRDGDSIRLKNLEVRGHLKIADTTNSFRVILFQMKGDPRAAGSLEVDDIVDDSSTLLGTVQAPYAPLNVNNKKQFHVISDRMYMGVSGQDNDIIPIHYNFPASKLLKKQKFAAGSATSVYGAPQFCIISDSAAATHPSLQLVFRLNYYDN